MVNITDKKNCCGCSACANICPRRCIRMEADSEGFLYPKIDETVCVHCNACDSVCPVKRNKPEKESPQTAYLLQNRDPQVLKESTSGGAFTAIAEKIIEKGGVVFGASFDEFYRVRHSYAETNAELRQFRNSKYVQSEIEDCFAQAKGFLERGRPVCFSGTPCQIEGLHNYLGKDYEMLLLVDFVCRAAPSPLAWEKYKEYRSRSGKVTQAAFRDKEPYGYDYSQISITANGEKGHFGVESDPYLRAFFSNLSDRPSCYACRFKKRYRISDITLWDCFEIHKFNRFLNNNRGVTRVLAHTQKGREMMASVQDHCFVLEISAEDAVKGVREMTCSVSENPNRADFFLDAQTMQSAEWFQKYFPMTAKVRTERLIRISSEKLGIYRIVKRAVKMIFKK